MVKAYYMKCGKCGNVISVGITNVVYQFYECVGCRTLNYPGQIDEDAHVSKVHSEV